MPESGFALQKAIHSELTANAAVIALLGGTKVFDDVPRGADAPYVTFGLTSVRDWGTSDQDGEEHILTLHVWSDATGRREAREIVGALRTALHDRPLTLDGHRLINMRQEFADTRREPSGEGYHGIVRLRAVTEPTG